MEVEEEEEIEVKPTVKPTVKQKVKVSSEKKSPLGCETCPALSACERPYHTYEDNREYYMSERGCPSYVLNSCGIYDYS
jgi:hypothetical protein